MKIARTAAALSGVAILGCGVIAGASPASAQVWHQSVERESSSAACPISDAADIESGWSEWGPSWEQWVNDGAGGYVCTRSIVWAQGTPPSGASGASPVAFASAGCIPRGGTFEYFFDFGGSYFISGSGHVYNDELCQDPRDMDLRSLVFAPAPLDADTLCVAAFGSTGGAELAPQSSVIYICNID